MKKFFCMLMTVVMIGSLAACSGSSQSSQAETRQTETAQTEAPQTETAGRIEEDEDFVWTREGYYEDENGNMLYVIASFSEEYPGWYVGCMIGEDGHGSYIEEEGKTLHGNIVGEYEETEDEFIVTLSEEGEDGILLEVEGGDAYHFMPAEIPEAAFSVTVNIKGWGQIAYAEEGGEPEFDEDFPSQSAYIGLEEAETYVFAAKPDDGWKFMKWTLNGEDYSKDAQITLEITEDTELIAVFGIAGTDETPVDLDNVKTLGELLGLPNYGNACTEGMFVQAFEQDGNIYRAIAECPEEVSEAIFELDFDEYDEKLAALISDLEVTRIDNLTEGIPSQEELDQLIGKTGQELMDDGWINYGWNLYDMEFYMSHGCYDYVIVFEGDVEDYDSFDDEDILQLVVKSVTFDEIGDPASLDD